MADGNCMLKWIEIDLSAIEHNLKAVLKTLKPQVRLTAVVKADAYGCGAVETSKVAARCGASFLGVLTVEEALVLRRANIQTPILLLSPPLPEQAPLVIQERLTPTIDSLKLAEALHYSAKTPIAVHLDLDYGLRRWGISPRTLSQFLTALTRFRKLEIHGISTHLDYVPGRNAVEAEEKLNHFHRLTQVHRRSHLKIICHAANSSILMDFPHWQMDMARIGNLLYGINPTDKEVPLKNPWKFCARIIAIQEVAKGSSIGYGSEYIAPRRMRVATLPVGYSDGLTMEPAERFIGLGQGFAYWGHLRGYKVPFVGRCGISHVLVDVTQVPHAKVGEMLTLPIRRTAANLRIPRVYKK